MPTALLSQATWMAAAVSRRKHAFSWAASSWLNGGTNRVLTWPARGAFVITAKAQRSAGAVGWLGSRILCDAGIIAKLFASAFFAKRVLVTPVRPKPNRFPGQIIKQLFKRRQVEHGCRFRFAIAVAGMNHACQDPH